MGHLCADIETETQSLFFSSTTDRQREGEKEREQKERQGEMDGWFDRTAGKGGIWEENEGERMKGDGGV